MHWFTWILWPEENAKFWLETNYMAKWWSSLACLKTTRHNSKDRNASLHSPEFCGQGPNSLNFLTTYAKHVEFLALDNWIFSQWLFHTPPRWLHKAPLNTLLTAEPLWRMRVLCTWVRWQFLFHWSLRMVSVRFFMVVYQSRGLLCHWIGDCWQMRPWHDDGSCRISPGPYRCQTSPRQT